jgi:betaine-aldehyde dehydrogenase
MPTLFIDGRWVASADGACSPVINPSDATIITEVDVATDAQVQAAIAAARRAFDTTDWPRRPTGERAALLDRVAGLIDRDLEAMARLETLDTGKAMRESRWDMTDVARVFRYYADLADKDAGRLVDTGNPDAVSRIVYEPVGVCGLIGPWNYPLLQMSWKVAPALAAGNTVVMKPAQVTPLTAIHLTHLFEEAGVPAGVDTTYGLAGAVWTADAGRAQRVAGRLRHGTVWINDYNTYLPQAEWGGLKQSGIGRELGPSGLDEYREAKHIWQNTAPGPTGWFGG